MFYGGENQGGGLVETLILARALTLEPNRTLELLEDIGDGPWRIPPGLKPEYKPVIDQWVKFLDEAGRGFGLEAGLMDKVSYSLVWRSNSDMPVADVEDVVEFINSAQTGLKGLITRGSKMKVKERDRLNAVALVRSIAERRFKSYSGLA